MNQYPAGAMGQTGHIGEWYLQARWAEPSILMNGTHVAKWAELLILMHGISGNGLSRSY